MKIKKILDHNNGGALPQPAQQEPLGFMNAGHIHEMQQGGLPYGYVYQKEDMGARVAIYTAPQPVQEFICSTGLCHYRKPLTNERLDEIESEILIDGGSYRDVLRAVADEARGFK